MVSTLWVKLVLSARLVEERTGDARSVVGSGNYIVLWASHNLSTDLLKQDIIVSIDHYPVKIEFSFESTKPERPPRLPTSRRHDARSRSLPPTRYHKDRREGTPDCTTPEQS